MQMQAQVDQNRQQAEAQQRNRRWKNELAQFMAQLDAHEKNRRRTMPRMLGQMKGGGSSKRSQET